MTTLFTKDEDDGIGKHFYDVRKTLRPSVRLYEEIIADHCESNVSFLERRSVVRAVSSHSDHFTVRVNATINDAFNKRVFVLRR